MPVPVVVSGIGLLTGLAPTREATWAALKAGQSAVRRLDRPDLPTSPPFFGCPAPVSVPPDREPVLDLLDLVLDEAIADARLGDAGFDPARVGVLVGSSKGGIRSLGRAADLIRNRPGDPEALAEAWRRGWPNAGALRVAARLGARGPCLVPVAACATGLMAVLQGADLIRHGVCDVAVVGSVDASLEPLLLTAFRTMRALASGKGDPTEWMRPWDRRRNGFLVGEGGALLVLERADGARGRGIAAYAEIAGGATGCDAHHETALNPDPEGLAHVIRTALRRSDVRATSIDHVNLHGTATRANDPLECAAIRAALGEAAHLVSCSANKPQIGHLLGAAGSAELAITCLAIRDGFVPPTRNLTDPDPSCDLDATPRVGRVRSIAGALKLSIGFGGHLAAAVLRRVDAP